MNQFLNDKKNQFLDKNLLFYPKIGENVDSQFLRVGIYPALVHTAKVAMQELPREARYLCQRGPFNVV